MINVSGDQSESLFRKYFPASMVMLIYSDLYLDENISEVKRVLLADQELKEI
jgi:hypothetical protein